jgi:hypothetical protein
MAVTDPRPAHHDGELSVTGDLPGTSAGEPPGGPPPGHVATPGAAGP